MPSPTTITACLEQIYKKESRRIYATLCRLLGDMDLAEEALQEAFHIALTQWQQQGVPDNPRAWLISTARFKVIDHLRRLQRHRELLQEPPQPESFTPADDAIEDDQLRLIFTCCHPALEPNVQIPLTLREVCGLTTEAIASAFLVSPTTMAQRIVRGKAKIRKAQVPFDIPEASELPQRLDAVLTVIYLVFNEGYNRSSGDTLVQVDLINEAVRLAELILQLLPDPEVKGLLALMLLHESRREARTDTLGDIILLEHQDRSRWNQALIHRGCNLVREARASNNVGFYTLQAAISAQHALAKDWASTPWPEIVALYALLVRVEPSPVIKLNQAVAVAMHRGPEAGLVLLKPLLNEKVIKDYHLLYATYGEFLSRLGRTEQAIAALEQAKGLTQQVPEQRVLQRKINELRRNSERS